MKFGITNPFLKKGNNGENILLTGVPRSGTTLACALLTDFSQTIALNEPMEGALFQNRESAISNIKKQFSIFRKSLLSNGTALARTREGKITDNAFDTNSKSRERVIQRTSVHYTKPLKEDFTLIMKHNAEFSLVLPELLQHYPVYALIRNPLAILSSWSSVNVPVSRGVVAKSEKLNPEFHTALNKQGNDLLTRQLFILSWYFGQYINFAPENIIRYESMIIDPESNLKHFAKGEFQTTQIKLSNRNTSSNYDKSKVVNMGNALLKSDGNYWTFYSKEDVINLLDQLESNEK